MDTLLSFKGDSTLLQTIGYWAARAYGEKDFILMYIHLLFSAVFPIYIGSFASLRCPPSAEDLSKKKRSASAEDGDEEDDEDELEEHTEFGGLTPSDAIMFPVLAGCVLAGLYFLIKWLKDPAILNRILGYYFSSLGIFGVGMLAGDTLNVTMSVIFPKAWSSGKTLYFVDPTHKQQVVDAPTIGMDRGAAVHLKFTDKTSPFPGRLSNLRLSPEWSRRFWSIRSLFLDHWILRAYFHGFVSTKARIRLNNVVGLLLGAVAIALYNFNGKAWWLSNLMGWGFCYNTLQYMSPTTFWTGSLVLTGLFFYDITMVFYTPMMITVATKLDVPIKLSIPGPGNGSMLGLGDIVLPGIMIALALRFDLYLFYLKQTKTTASSVHSPKTATSFNQTQSITRPRNPKPAYVSATGNWGTSFWTRSISKENLPATLKGAFFPKIYFWASIFGYLAGMCVTLGVLTIFKHGQPALLYLVPGVLGALWGTAFFRGETTEMCNYTEAGEELPEEEDKVENITGTESKGDETKKADGKQDTSEKPGDPEHKVSVKLELELRGFGGKLPSTVAESNFKLLRGNPISHTMMIRCGTLLRRIRDDPQS